MRIGCAVLCAIAVSGCGGDAPAADAGSCVADCVPACAGGTVCSSSAEVRGATQPFPPWSGQCLKKCSRPSDCPAYFTCRLFEGGSAHVCANDTVPTPCPPLGSSVASSCDAYSPSCADANTLSQGFYAITTNGTCGFELQTCANGCETIPPGGDGGLPIPTGRCR